MAQKKAKKKPGKRDVTRSSLKASAEAAMMRWVERHPPEEMDCRIGKVIDKMLPDLVMQVLGFTSSGYPKHWKLDTCNGRFHDSTVGKVLRERVAKSVERSASKIMSQVPQGVPKETMDELRGKWLDYFRSSLDRKVLNLARAQAAGEVHKAMANTLKRLGIVPARD